MAPRVLQKRPLVAAVLFVAAVLVLAVQLITPSPVMVSLGDNGAEATQLGQYFTYRDVAVIAITAFLCGTSGTYLVLHDRERVLVDPNRPPSTAEGHTRPNPKADGGSEDSSGVRASPDRETRRKRWEETAEKLKNNEETVYSMLVDADGKLAQRKIVEETDLSKATVSRTLDKLENRDLVERRRNGMGNVVHLR